MRQRQAIVAILMSCWLPLGDGRAEEGIDEEMDKHLATLRSQVENTALSMPRREQFALEMAATLDRAAQSARTSEARRARWTEAIALIDGFEKQNPGHPQAHQFQFQAAVYLWARGRIWAEQAELAPADHDARRSAVENLDVAISRLRSLNNTVLDPTSVLSQNVRFRLAQTLADRAELEPEDSAGRRTRLGEASKLLETPIPEPALQGFAQLLRAQVLDLLGDDAGARAALDAAAKSVPAPPEEALLEARVTSLLSRARFDEALKAIEGSKAPAPLKGLLTVRVRLAQRNSMAPGSARRAAESALFQAVRPLRGSGAPEARLALLELGRSVEEPDETQDPDAWDALAEAALARGDQPLASTLMSRGADRALALGKPEQAAAMRLRAGAALFQAGKFLEADTLLSRVAGDARAGDARPKAGLLRTLARGRALALRLPGASQKAYVDALEAQIRDFPADPSANEARWLLARLRLASSDREGARTLWSEIPRSDPRWLDARLGVAGLRQDEVDNQRINNDRALVRQRFDEARAFLAATLEQCRSDAERTAVDLALARLELTPDAGRPEEALKLCERIQRSAGQVAQRDKARRLQVVALADLNHFVEAETLARAEAQRAPAGDLLDTVRLLDQIASETESDLRMRRFGLILRTLLARVLDREDDLSPGEKAEARLRQTRALLLSGDDARARASLADGVGTSSTLDDRLLKDLADAYVRLGAYKIAADVHRLRAQRAPTGSLPWFEARYGLALAYYRSGRARDVAKLIDGTAILHPDLGGGELRDKFIQLRQRVNPDE